ncbi:uncharacterized protein BKA78DRAFT_126224 [Phyllosticta capitalensis]|uniref:uncharacterized protein n=1 Tax=Phyllosticta capitalensis TaxID=121624 RepID=UPI00312EE688
MQPLFLLMCMYALRANQSRASMHHYPGRQASERAAPAKQIACILARAVPSSCDRIRAVDKVDGCSDRTEEKDGFKHFASEAAFALHLRCSEAKRRNAPASRSQVYGRTSLRTANRKTKIKALIGRQPPKWGSSMRREKKGKKPGNLLPRLRRCERVETYNDASSSFRGTSA